MSEYEPAPISPERQARLDRNAEEATRRAKNAMRRWIDEQTPEAQDRYIRATMQATMSQALAG